MQSFLEELFLKFGRRNRDGFCFDADEELKKEIDKLKNEFNETQNLHLLRIVDSYDEIIYLMSYINFKRGLILGTRLALEMVIDFCEDYDFIIDKK